MKAKLLYFFLTGLLTSQGGVKAQDTTATPTPTFADGPRIDATDAPTYTDIEPIILFNATFDEFVEQYTNFSNIDQDVFWQNFTDTLVEGEVVNATSVSDEDSLAVIERRDVVGGENNNDALANRMLQALHALCQENFESDVRAESGSCKSDGTRRIECNNLAKNKRRILLINCGPGNECVEFRGHNFDDIILDFPTCGLVEDASNPTGDGRYSGQWHPEIIGNPSKKQFIHFYATAIGEQIHFDWNYNALANVGDRGLSTYIDQKGAHSVACIYCPANSGTLSFTHFNNAQKVAVASYQAEAPGKSDFQFFFHYLERTVAFRDKIVFWSGVGIENSQKFARERNRYTLEMLLKKNWAYFQTDKAHGGYWNTWDEAVTGFWDVASEALAELAIDTVMAFFTLEREEEQKHPNCKRCWYRIEKPVLVNSLHSTDSERVREIRKYVQVAGGEKFVGLIEKMSD